MEKVKNQKIKLVNKLENEKKFIEVTLIITDCSLLIFEELEYQKRLAQLLFWANLFSIIDLRINKKEKDLTISFFNDSKNIDLEIKLKIENILLFKEALIKRTTQLKIKAETQKKLKGKIYEKRFNDRDINNMTIDELINNFKYFDSLLKLRRFNFYNVNTYFNVTKKIVEYYSARNDQNHSFYLNKMKEVLKDEEVKQIFISS